MIEQQQAGLDFGFADSGCTKNKPNDIIHMAASCMCHKNKCPTQER